MHQLVGEPQHGVGDVGLGRCVAWAALPSLAPATHTTHMCFANPMNMNFNHDDRIFPQRNCDSNMTFLLC
jgi:hypothetical protein